MPLATKLVFLAFVWVLAITFAVYAMMGTCL